MNIFNQIFTIPPLSYIKLGEYPEATVLFCDVPAFPTIVPFCQPKGIVRLLNELFTKFDRLVNLHDVRLLEHKIVKAKMLFSGVQSGNGESLK
jgi:class 3 adenylate cyclase